MVAADFNNDMHTDLVLVPEDRISSRPPLLFVNQANGTFVKTFLGPDAPSTVYGPQFAPHTIGRKAITADYNQDGFLDLFLNNTQLSLIPAPLLGAPAQLLQNSGDNGNHWIELDLQGVLSNRDAVGAQVYVTAGGVSANAS